ncbi:hypothetical protein FQA39_LY01991 [Lamprigera yunnana]|nr:hypothetical protein FQA39_LY01991 [Lamprigera yunnana]
MSRSKLNEENPKQDLYDVCSEGELDEDNEYEDIDEEETACPKLTDDDCNLYTSSYFCDLLKLIAESESDEKLFFGEYKRIDLTSLHPRDYLEKTVVPILVDGMQYLVTERPPEPINALCVFLLKNKDRYEQFCNLEPPTEDDEEEKEL